MNISVVIITKNEEKMITDCLKSIDFASEIIVVDTGNTDKTNEIAKKYKARIVKYKGRPNFAGWRNQGLKSASGDWILYIDADERLTPLLKNEISNVSNEFSAYAIPRKNFIFGKEFKHGGQFPDYQKRLFKRSELEKWEGNLHEEPVYEGELGHLKNPMLHIKHESLSEMVEKTNEWSEVEAKLMLDAKHPRMNIKRFTSAMAREFWNRMIRQMAFLDGGEGIIYGLYQVFSRFVSYAKLWEMQLNASRNI